MVVRELCRNQFTFRIKRREIIIVMYQCVTGLKRCKRVKTGSLVKEMVYSERDRKGTNSKS